MDLLKDYDCTIQYHPGKGNVVADALSRQPNLTLASLMRAQWRLLEEAAKWSVDCGQQFLSSLTISQRVKPDILSRIEAEQFTDPTLDRMRIAVERGASPHSTLRDGVLYFKGRLCVPQSEALQRELLREAHSSRYTIHPGATKMYRDMKKQFWWRGMKRDIAQFVSRCLVCQQVKAEHQSPGGLLLPLQIPEWKWEQIAMDFVIGLPRTTRGFDAIWVVVDRLTKTARFLPIKITW